MQASASSYEGCFLKVGSDRDIMNVMQQRNLSKIVVIVSGVGCNPCEKYKAGLMTLCNNPNYSSIAQSVVIVKEQGSVLLSLINSGTLLNGEKRLVGSVPTTVVGTLGRNNNGEPVMVYSNSAQGYMAPASFVNYLASSGVTV
ncbi:hypothetical protein NECID01_0371 [Nematocida sp. AWRm77]|nr:hypothetical protein NECID01_0371 [Nematocida sp. AWRm77]